MIGEGEVLVALGPRPLRHLGNAVAAIGPRRVRVEVAPDVVQLDERGEPVLKGGFDLAAVLAQLGRDPVHAQRGEDLLLRLGRDRRSTFFAHAVEAVLVEE